jgi:hypothetical protein
MGHATNIGGLAVLFLPACLKNKNTKGQSAICEGMEKIQSVFLERLEKYKKKHTKIQGVIVVVILYFLLKNKIITNMYRIKTK